MKKILFLIIIIIPALHACTTFTGILREQKKLNAQAIDNIKELPVSESFSFVLFGDNREGYDTYRKVIRLTNKIKPLFAVNTGDIVPDGSLTAYKNFLKMSEPLSIPYLVIPGNHDVREEGRKYFKNIFGPSNYYFDYSNCRFIFLDNSESYLTTRQLAWLEDKLKTKKHKFIFMHYPPETGNWHSAMTYNNKPFQKIVERNHVDFVFCGHIHFYDKYVKNGVNYVVSGGAGASYSYMGDVGGKYINHLLVVEVKKDVIKESIKKLGEATYKSKDR